MPTKNQALFTFLCLLLFAPLAFAAENREPEVKIDEIKTGEGTKASLLAVVEVHYTGKLDNGEVFDSSIERGKPIKFTLGSGQVIPGWDMGIRGMQPGGKRILTIPPQLAYGARGVPNVIPANATLTFDVELVSVIPPPFISISNQQLADKLTQGITLIDIRRPEEWKETGVVKNSIKSTAIDQQGRLQMSFLNQLKETVKPDEEFAVICRTGNRTAVLSNWLVTKGGYKNVLNVEDGITSWIGEGRPVSKN